MRPFDDALEAVVTQVGVWRGVERVGLSEAVGRRLARDYEAPENIPAAPTSAMDGYAFAWEASRTHYRLCGRVAAGEMPTRRVESGEAMKVMTGALLPEGADTVVPIEKVEVVGEEIVIVDAIAKGSHVRGIGQEIKQAERLLERGRRIGFAEIGLLAQFGAATVDVKMRPVVGVLSTGSELVEPGEARRHPAQIRSVNNHLIVALASEMGAHVHNFGVAGDAKELLAQRIADAFNHCDLVVTTGGVSVGDFDFVKEIVHESEMEIVVNKSAIKPGQHLVIARKEDKWLLALPGFSYSALVTFRLFGGAILEYWLADRRGLSWEDAIAGADFVKRSNKTEFVPVRVVVYEGGYHVMPTERYGITSADISTLLGCDALMMIPAQRQGVVLGDKVKILSWRIA